MFSWWNWLILGKVFVSFSFGKGFCINKDEINHSFLLLNGLRGTFDILYIQINVHWEQNNNWITVKPTASCRHAKRREQEAN